MDDDLIARLHSATDNRSDTIVDLLRWRAASQPKRVAYTFLQTGGQAEENLTYGELDQYARALAVRLQDLNMQGQRALLLLPAGLDYIIAFFGCLYAGVIAV